MKSPFNTDNVELLFSSGIVKISTPYKLYFDLQYNALFIKKTVVFDVSKHIIT